MKLTLDIDCIPPKATSQQKGVFMAGGKPRFFKKAHVAQAERDWVTLLMEAKPDGYAMVEGPVEVFAVLTWPYRKSEPKKRTVDGVCIPCDTKPDLDNVSKMLLDSMTRCGYWRDDSQVYDLHLVKCWGPKPGVRMEIVTGGYEQ